MGGRRSGVEGHSANDSSFPTTVISTTDNLRDRRSSSSPTISTTDHLHDRSSSRPIVLPGLNMANYKACTEETPLIEDLPAYSSGDEAILIDCDSQGKGSTPRL